MKISLKHLAAIAAAALVIAEPVAALAACNQIPLNKTCLQRGVQNLDRRVNGSGFVVCGSHAGAPYPLQYDKYSNINGFTVYICTIYRSCTWAKNNDTQAYNKFC